MAELLLSDKYLAFLRHTAPVEFLEGTTAAGKTTVGIFKFMLMVAESPKKIHILSGLDLGTVEKNIITKELGILDDFGDLVTYWRGGRGEYSLPHLEFHTGKDGRDIKIIYVLGYDNKNRWKKALGGQYGCIYIDEINIADMEYVREIAMRGDYLMGTLNPDDPSLPIYEEYINCSRPLPEWEYETPEAIMNQLNQPHKEGWVHWFFSFDHNLGLPPEKKAQIIGNVPKGTKLYKNKILGLRGRAEGLVFNLEDWQVKSERELRRHMADEKEPLRFLQFTAALDTAYSQKSPDTFAFTFCGITACRKLIVLDTAVYNNKTRKVPLTPSDLPQLYEQFLEINRARWGFARDAFIDSADQATILECQKYRRNNGCIYNFLPAWKKTTIIDRIKLQSGWMAQGNYYILEHCRPLIDELNVYSWKDDKYEPEDGNDHCINSCQYAWLPFKDMIGGIKK